MSFDALSLLMSLNRSETVFISNIMRIKYGQNYALIYGRNTKTNEIVIQKCLFAIYMYMYIICSCTFSLF